MGAWDWISDKAGYVEPWNKKFLSVADPGNLLGQNGGSVPNQPGVTANGDSNQQNLVRDPVTGMYVDPTTGNVYMDALGKNGKGQVTNPNVAQQVARNAGISDAMLAKFDQDRKNSQIAQSGQGQLVGQLDDQITGKGPSVAGSQIASTLGNIQRTQMAGASGVGGESAFAARRAALTNIGNQQQQASQNLATLRAQETASALQQKGNVLGALAGEANTQSGQSLSGAHAFSGDALQGQEAQQGLNANAATQQDKDRKDRENKVIGAIGTLF